MVGRHRPVEQDSLRLLTIVHQLGGATEPSTECHRFIDTESRPQQLDHLVRHPIDLTYVLIDQIRSRGADLESPLEDLARRVRRLLGAPRRGRHRPRLLRPFDAGSWRRWDDALALLGCRGLLRVEPAPVATSTVESASGRGGDGRGELRYRLTSEGARWLRDSVYPRQQGRAERAPRERCELLRAVLPSHLLGSEPRPALGSYLRDVERRLDAYRSDEQVRPEDDLLARLFQSTFSEEL